MTDAIIRTHSGVDADARRWRAVLARDVRADGAFVYAVGSTGIYCRASCPSRKPRRDRVTFFDSPAEARQSGFRPCKRCRPDAIPVDGWAEKIRRACVHLANAEGHPSLAALAAQIGGSPYHLQRNFKRLVGLTPRQYAEACRLGKVKRRLRGGEGVTAAMLEAGYGSSSRFYERAVPKLGMRPVVYRRGGAGMSIQYTIVDSAAGRLLVAATERGVCAVAMGASDRELTRNLAREYPAATIAPGAGSFTEWTKRSGAAGRTAAAGGSAAARSGDGVSVAGLAGARGDTVRRDAELRRDCLGHRPAAGGTCRRARVRDQPGRDRDSLPPRGRPIRRGQWLPVGRRAEESAAGQREATLTTS